MFEWTNKFTNEWINEWTNRPDKQANEWMDERPCPPPPLPSPFAEGGERYSYGLGQKFVEDEDCVLLNALRYEALESADDGGGGVFGGYNFGWTPGLKHGHLPWFRTVKRK